MKRYIPASIFMILFLTCINVQAQTPEPPFPWPPAPAEIFYEDVQWALFEREPPPPRPVQIDYDQKVIRVHDSAADTLQEFPFPEDMGSLYSATMRSDGKILVGFNFDFPVNPGPRDFLLLDPETGLYEQPPTVCNGQIIQAEPGDGVWTVAYFDDEREAGFLCFSEDGEQLDVLPVEYTGWQVSTSNDGTWFVLIARNWKEGGDYRVFSYHIEDDRLIELGTVRWGMDNMVSVCDWLTDTQGLLCTSDFYRSWPGRGYYAFDVTRADSIEYAFSSWGADMLRIEDPLRYISVISTDYAATFTGSSGAHTCRLTIYDAGGIRRQELGYECIPILLGDTVLAPYYRQGNTIYYLTVEGEDSTVSTLRSYDAELETGNTPIFTGEVETILGVSPDSRYIVVLLDDNGKLDFPWRANPCCFESGWQVAIIHHESGQIIYRSERIGVYAATQVHWLDETTVVVAAAMERHYIRVTDEGDGIPHLTASTLRRINVGNGDVFITTQFGLLRGVVNLNVTPKGNYWLRENNTVIDLRSFEQVPVLRDDIPENYVIHTDWLGDGDLQIRVYHRDDFSYAVFYRVTLP